MTTDDRTWLAQHFEEHRTHLRAVAYRMLGSLSEADDAVQEAWLRLSRTDADEIENLGGWLTTVVARVSLNMLRSRRSHREESLGVQMPEPIVDRTDGTDPEHEALLADSVGLALLVVLETLSPPERLAFGEDRPPGGGRVCPRARVGGCRGRPAGSAERRPTRRSTIPALHPAPSADGAGSDRRFAGRYASSSSTTAPPAKPPASDAT